MSKAEQIDFEQAVYDAFGQVKDFTLATRIARYFYEQAEKDIIAKIWEQVEEWMPDNPEGDEHITGERMAFWFVLNLLKEMEEEQ